METLSNALEQVMADRRVQIVGAVLAAVVLAISLGLIVASKSPSRFKALATHLPEHTLEIPIMRSLPEPLPKANAPVSRTGGKPARTVTARR
jgi:predicted PurR-regulated permease PerM